MSSGMARWGHETWVLITLRKTTSCTLSRVPMHKGDRAWRPLTNGRLRMWRIAEDQMPAASIVMQPAQK